jgi:hypothetical protein
MEKTAVEFLERMRDTFGIITTNDLKKAKEMEKQQIIDADVNGSFRTAEALDCKISLFGVKELAQQYYEETFNKG